GRDFMKSGCGRRWLGWGSVGIVSGLNPLAGSPPAGKPDLSGLVLGPGNQPDPNAPSFISTTRPKQGAGHICPSLLPHCRESAQPDGQGQLEIEALDAALLFRVLVTAPGYGPKFAGKVDPGKGPLSVPLARRDLSKFPPKQILAGRVLDAAQKPVIHASV